MMCFLTTSQAGGPDFFIDSVLSRNRALNDDCVIIKISPKDKWIVSEIMGLMMHLLKFILKFA